MFDEQNKHFNAKPSTDKAINKKCWFISPCANRLAGKHLMCISNVCIYLQRKKWKMLFINEKDKRDLSRAIYICLLAVGAHAITWNVGLGPIPEGISETSTLNTIIQVLRYNLSYFVIFLCINTFLRAKHKRWIDW